MGIAIAIVLLICVLLIGKKKKAVPVTQREPKDQLSWIDEMEIIDAVIEDD